MSEEEFLDRINDPNLETLLVDRTTVLIPSLGIYVQRAQYDWYAFKKQGVNGPTLLLHANHCANISRIINEAYEQEGARFLESL